MAKNMPSAYRVHRISVCMCSFRPWIGGSMCGADKKEMNNATNLAKTFLANSNERVIYFVRLVRGSR